MTSPFLYFPGGPLSAAELAAARLDGHVVEIGEGFMPADAVETCDLRAGSLAPLVPAAFAATHLSAAWVHGAVDRPPPRHVVQRRSPRRLASVMNARVRYSDVRLAPDDVVIICGVAVTTPSRTLADLARSRDPADRAAAAGWAAASPALRAAALAWLAGAGPVHDKRAAATFLTGLEVAAPDQEVTR
ncbi:type IV toxin-antitoxin system AbiEi family antitoxin [Microbacterium sp. zg.Y1090]|uniref:type IV toxin-antitoxin system AbiEi family antitoxin n=1 Tax=Microbacterium TaxID=33882 RepID=UPI00214C3DE9|nr:MULTISPECIES: type IV toxin-antitoxin system AbiEi family antitoxin [unclassified Microbacterium]MCR2811880.1 type IV toxin-antitoxin system AbiEi family antitoxin [Microbacterium sp. zg.Y1084]MCR2818681.1 type IV toxin-antitoxin system AbiEi family antitoxin [Microbacterium sp. zg.Y1090]MDL5486494.1 type IV toxin-antitoxin system AbiEi family antitoxin [Microbacterium sp. zg-Y1211]WIM27003.1 type IV toxin-antitoxin system AbiEi family antitoxin [Microbacterium sp. zg-Y1090]